MERDPHQAREIKAKRKKISFCFVFHGCDTIWIKSLASQFVVYIVYVIHFPYFHQNRCVFMYPNHNPESVLQVAVSIRQRKKMVEV